MSPLLGLHTVLGIAVAYLFGLNKFVTVVGVYITNPWTIVPIYTFSTWLGARIFGMDHVMPRIDWAHLSVAELIHAFGPLLLPFVVGSTLLGFLSAGFSYYVVFRAVRKSRG